MKRAARMRWFNRPEMADSTRVLRDRDVLSIRCHNVAIGLRQVIDTRLTVRDTQVDERQ